MLNPINSLDKKIFFILTSSMFFLGCLVLIYNQSEIENYIQYFLFFNIAFMLIFYIYMFKRVSYIDPTLLLIVSIILYELPKLEWYLGLYTITEIESIALSSFVFRGVDYFNGSVLYLLYTNLCVFIILITSAFCDKNYHYENYSVIDNKKSIFYLYMFFGLFVIGAFLKYSNFNILYLLSSRQGVSEAKAVKNSMYFFTLLCFTLQILFIRLISVEHSFSRKALSYLMFLMLCITSYLLTGSRGFTVYSILAIYIFKVNHNGCINWKSLISLSIIVALSFSILGVIRNTNIDDISVDSIASSYQENKTSSLSSYQLQLRDELIFDKSDKIESYYFSFYLSPLTSIFPREVIGDFKLPMIDGVIAKDIWERNNIGLPVNSTTESFLSYKYLGVFMFVPFIVMLKYAYYNFVMPNNLVSIYLPLIVLSQTFLTSKLFFSIQILIFTMVLLYISRFFPKDEKQFKN